MLYKELCGVYKELEGTTKRLEKTRVLSEFLPRVKVEEIKKTLLLLQGRIFPRWEESEIGFSSNYVIKALSLAAGLSEKKIKEEWKETGDLGKTAKKVMKKGRQSTLFSEKLTVDKVFKNLKKLTTIEGEGTVDYKVKKVVELLNNAQGVESKFIIKTILDELRIGVGEGTLRDSLVWSFLPRIESINCKEGEVERDFEKLKEIKKSMSFESEKEARKAYNWLVEQVQEAYDITNDFSEVAIILKKEGLKGLEKLSLKPGKPIKVMLALKEESIEDAFERMGEEAAIELKLDGFRMQIHKHDGKVQIFTRRLEDVTKRFPEVKKYVEENIEGESFIIDCEGVGFEAKTGKKLPFQNISQRIKRKYDIHDLANKLPVELNVFDIMQYEGRDLLKKPFKKRRELIEKVVKEEKKKIVLVKQIITGDEKRAEDFYEESLKMGNEGVMFKNLEAPYKPGARVGYMVKMKPVMETLDLVIVKAEWGEGKRANWLSSYTLACRDDKGDLKTIGKVSTGLKEKEEEGLSFKEMTEKLKPLVVKSEGREVKVKPEVVIEVSFEEIQKSPTYESGFALRFPRVVRIREDRAVDECSDLELVKSLYEKSF